MMVTNVEEYFIDGCGRCKLFRTPDCKVHTWKKELLALREIALQSGLEEQMKWGQLCYTLKGKNVLLIAAFKEYCGFSFFKGALLSDSYKILDTPSDFRNESRQLKFQNVNEILALAPKMAEYIQEAIEVERQGLKVTPKKVDDYEKPQELIEKMESDNDFKKAFESLTPGRQKSYIIHFSQAKQAKTRMERIEKCTEKIFSGKGFHD